MKVPKMRRGRISNNKVEIGASYLGIGLSYQGNVESIPEVNQTEGLEFEIDKRIRILTQKKTKIAFATSEGELSTTAGPQGQGGGLSALKQYMDFFEAVPTDLKGKQIPDDVAALVIAGPEAAVLRARQVRHRSVPHEGQVGRLLRRRHDLRDAAADADPGTESSPQIGRKNDTGLDDLLAHYGFKVDDDVILEPQKNVPGPLMVDGQMQLGNYPTFLVTDSIAKSSPLFDHVDALIVPFASSVELIKDNKAQAGLVYTQLAQSSAQAWRQKGFFLLNPTVPLKPADDKGPFALGYTAEGKFKSFFAGKPFPNEKGEKVTPTPNVSLPPDVGEADRRGAGAGAAVRVRLVERGQRHLPRGRVALRAGLPDRPRVRAQRHGLAGAGQGAVVDPRQGDHAAADHLRVGVDADGARGDQHHRRAARVHPLRRVPLAHPHGAARAREDLTPVRTSSGSEFPG